MFKNTLEKLKKKTQQTLGQRISLKVCMMGPRAVGKTSILASIFHETDSKLVSSSLNFSPIGDTVNKLKKQYEELYGIFENVTDVMDKPRGGIHASDTTQDFHFTLGLKQQQPSVDIDMTDFPGEFLEPTHVRHADVKQFIRESQVIMIAVDTVHLMEEEGTFNENRNQSAYLCEKIIHELKELETKDTKIILFVPLKCEKYMYELRMDEVASKVCAAYAPLLETIAEDDDYHFDKRIAAAITPIATLGGIVFSHFEKNEDGNIITEDTDNGCPAETCYKFYAPAPRYAPCFCVQPLYYLIAFAIGRYKSQQKGGNVISNTLKGLASLFSSDVAFFKACQEMVANLKTRGKGFKVLQNPELFPTPLMLNN